MNLKILLVEDDPFDAEMIQNELGSHLNASIELITTESEFINKFERIATTPPAVIIVDVMLRWGQPSADLKLENIPTKVLEDGFYSAGLRCIELLEQDPRTRAIPYVIYSGLDRSNFAKRNVITKSNDCTDLIEEIRKLMERGASAN